jgi:hypothetical protein
MWPVVEGVGGAAGIWGESKSVPVVWLGLLALGPVVWLGSCYYTVF